MSTWKELIQRANTDAKFRDRLKADPTGVCKEAGLALPAGGAVEVVEERAGELHLFLGDRTGAPEINRMLDQAESDAAYKQQLLADPRKCVETATCRPLPSGIRVHIHDRAPDRIRVLLTPSDGDGALSDAELEAVAGGGFFKNLWTNITCRNVNVVSIVDGGKGGKDVIISGVDRTGKVGEDVDYATGGMSVL